MKIPVCFLSALAGLILNVATSARISTSAEEGNAEVERIVGGSSAQAGQFPWTAALFQNNRFICTCSIIGERTVLTAAHCVVTDGVPADARSFHAIANVRKSASSVRINFSNLTVHPEYNEARIENDIAIFNATDIIPFSDNVQPICIALSNTDPMELDNVLAMGWGDTKRYRNFPVFPDVLQYVQQEVIGPRDCGKYYGGEDTFDESKICAGDNFGGICNGDTGGPLVLPGADTQSAVQVGVASYGNAVLRCGFLAPSVWSWVSFYNDFIKEAAAGDAICER